MAEDIWVYAEHDGDGLTDLSLQCLSRGRALATQQGGQLAAMLLGSEVSGLVETLTAHGPDLVLVAEDQRLQHYSPGAYQRVITTAVKDRAPRVLLFPASTQGSDLAPAVALATGAACVVDCSSIESRGNELLGKRLGYDRKVLSAYAGAAAALQIFTAQDGIAEASTPGTGRTTTVLPVDVRLEEADLLSGVLKREIAERTANLKEARVIVACGAGVGSKDNFALIEELARVVGGEVGASRAAVDAGWTTLDRQIGQTGVTVRPDLYIACGISGAVQHRVGMMDSKRIVAINNDPNAPIFRFSHYCVLGDLVGVIPKLIKLWQS